MKDEMPKMNGWNEWAHRVLGDLERLEDGQITITKAMNRIEVEIAILQTKAAFMGGVWGAGVSIIVSVVASVLLHSLGAK